MDKQEVNIKVYRFDPSKDKKPYYQDYIIPYEEGMKVIDALIYISEEIDHTLSFRCSCLTDHCKICLVNVDGRTVLGCREGVREGLVIEPASNYKIIKDLVVHMARKNATLE